MVTHSVLLPANPMDRGAWPATVHRVAKSLTQLKRLARMNTRTAKYYEKQTHAHSDGIKI